MAIPRYPRPGQAIAPQTLHEVLEVPIPARVLEEDPSAPEQLCDLDQESWQRYSPDACTRFGNAVVREVSSKIASFPESILNRRLPAPPEGVSLDELGLENRTYNCLRASGFSEKPFRLGELTVGEALAIRGFGAKSLVDLLTVLEYRDPIPNRNPPRELPAPRTLGSLSIHIAPFPRAGHRIAPRSLVE
ncbi:MAG: hypothetical protein V3T77_01635, partial [Planctomycetota bacterium]